MVCVALVTNGVFEIWVSYREHKDALIQIQHEQAESAAAKIGQFIKEIESQVGWTTQLLWSAGTIEQRRFDALRLLRQVPAITELAQVDASGKEQLRVSRLAMDVVGSGLDLSKEPKFTDAVKNKVYYGPVYFRRESEPYMTLSLAGTRRDAGVSIAEVNLKLIWDVVSKIKVGEHGHAYVVDAQGRLIAHPDISLVLRKTDMTRLAQVQAAQRQETGAAAEDIETATDIQGRQVLTAFAPVAPLGWTVFVELPVDEAYQPLITSMQRTALVLLGALFLAALAGIFLARRMMVPIQALRAGAARIGGGDLSQRISIKSGDELEALADQFNDMAGRLQESYADLEQKVEVRTHELSESLEQQTATSEVLQVISSSPGELEPVFQAMLANAVRICEAKFGMLFRFEDGDGARGCDAWRTAGICRVLATRTATAGSANRPRPRHRDEADGSHRRCHGRPSLHRGRTRLRGRRQTRRLPDHSHRSDAQGQRADRRHRHLPPGGPAVHRQADRAGAELRRPGRHRHREHAAAQRAAPAHRRSHRVAGAADRDLGGAAGHLQLARRAGAGVPGHAGERDAHLRGQVRHAVPLRRRRLFRAVAHARRAAGACRIRRAARRVSARRGQPRSAASCRQSRSVHIADDAAERDPEHRRRKLGGARSHARRADAQGQRADRRHRHLPPGGAPVHRQADRAGDRTSPRRPSSPSRTRGCSTSCASAPTI